VTFSGNLIQKKTTIMKLKTIKKTETQAPNSTYPKGGVSCYKNSFAVNHPPQADFKSRFVVKVPPLG